MRDLFTLSSTGQGEFRERSSIFNSYAYKIFSLDDIKQILNRLRTEYRDSSHICYAYRLWVDGRLDEFSTDAGEPKGSSGPPILRVIRKNELVNICIIIIRHFGGTKLGIPGLMNAYGTSAENCIQNSKIIPWIITIRYCIHHQYDHNGLIGSLVRQFEGRIIYQEFGETIKTELEIAEIKSEEFRSQIFEQSSGRLDAKKI